MFILFKMFRILLRMQVTYCFVLVLGTVIANQAQIPKKTLDWQQMYCQHLCNRTLGCRVSNKGSYCKVDQVPPVCFGVYRLPRQNSSTEEKARNPLRFCDSSSEKGCKDDRLVPVGCSRRPRWNKAGQVIDLENFLELA